MFSFKIFQVRVGAALLCALLFASALWAGSQTTPRPDSPTTSLQDLHLPESANTLVQQAIDNELKAITTRERFQFKGRKLTPTGTVTKEYIETNDGPVARVIAINDTPLNPEQRQSDDARLHKLLTDPDAQRKHKRDEQEDEERVKKMLHAMPDAFIYEYDGAEKSNDGPVVRLRFKPNPNFNPPNRETQVYRGMAGTMLVNATEKRLVEMNAKLFQQVNFGWGFFGHLDPGGYFIVRQSKIGEGRWETTEMQLRFTGRILMVKKLSIDEHDTEFDFHAAPDNLTLAQGIQILQRSQAVVAQQALHAAASQ